MIKDGDEGLKPRYITFGYRKKVQDLKEWVAVSRTENEIKGISMCDVVLKSVGRMFKARHYFSYQVYEGKIIVIGGSLTNGEILKSTELVDCNGERGSDVSVSMNKETFPHMNRKRHLH